MNRQLTAKSLRMNRYYVPDHIPDRAVIDADAIIYVMGHHCGIGDMMATEFIKSVRIDFDKFTWEPYRRRTNARPLVSRAKREGLYCGKYKKPNIDFDPFKEANPSPVGHRRVGYDNCAVPLRHRKDYVATTVEEAHSILDKIIAKGTS